MTDIGYPKSRGFTVHLMTDSAARTESPHAICGASELYALDREIFMHASAFTGRSPGRADWCPDCVTAHSKVQETQPMTHLAHLMDGPRDSGSTLCGLPPRIYRGPCVWNAEAIRADQWAQGMGLPWCPDCLAVWAKRGHIRLVPEAVEKVTPEPPSRTKSGCVHNLCPNCAWRQRCQRSSANPDVCTWTPNVEFPVHLRAGDEPANHRYPPCYIVRAVLEDACGHCPRFEERVEFRQEV